MWRAGIEMAAAGGIGGGGSVESGETSAGVAGGCSASANGGINMA